MVRTVAKLGRVWPALQGQPHLSTGLVIASTTSSDFKRGRVGTGEDRSCPLFGSIWQVAVEVLASGPLAFSLTAVSVELRNCHPFFRGKEADSEQ